MSEEKTRKADPYRLRRGKTSIKLTVDVDEDLAIAIEADYRQSGHDHASAAALLADVIRGELNIRVAELRRAGKQVRLAVLDAERAALAAELNPDLARTYAAKRDAGTDPVARVNDAGYIVTADPEDHDEADEPPPVPPKKHGWDAAKDRGAGGGP